jgi:N-acetylmuramic acid 6-phosphate etherase
VSEAQNFIGIEGGGTRTIALVAAATNADAESDAIRLELGPGNVRLLSDEQLRDLFGQIATVCARPAAVGIGMAGVRDEADRRRIQNAVEMVWGKIPVAITHDMGIALAAAQTDAPTKVLVLSGTGSCCFGQSGEKTEKVGGWGHVLGDRGSGYDIALSALRAVVYDFDRKGKFGALGRAVLRAISLNEPNDLIAWIQSATKAEVAAVAPVVFAKADDPIARNVLSRSAATLATDAMICAARLSSKQKPVAFVFAGSVLLKQPAFAKKISRLIKMEFRLAKFLPLEREAVWGAIEMARPAFNGTANRSAPGGAIQLQAPIYYVPEFNPAESPTEQRNPRSMRFHELPTSRMVDLMLDTEAETMPAIRKEKKTVLRAVEMAAETLKRGGRIFYVGAGTSGRLGILDASECPPTFRADPEMIQGIIAGGQRAIWQAVEGAEDDAAAGARALAHRSLTPKDLVIGIAASGRTPFVWGALGFAKTTGARTVLLCFNPSLKVQTEHRPDVMIAPNLGPEILTGSTRLKSGTATKIILNMISTLAMVRLGKVIGNLMVDLNPSNVKLRDRAIRIVRELTGCTADAAKMALEKNGWVVKDAWAELKARRGN